MKLGTAPIYAVLHWLWLHGKAGAERIERRAAGAAGRETGGRVDCTSQAYLSHLTSTESSFCVLLIFMTRSDYEPGKAVKPKKGRIMRRSV